MQITVNNRDGIKSFGIAKAENAGNLQKYIRAGTEKMVKSIAYGAILTATTLVIAYDAASIAKKPNDRVLLGLLGLTTGTAAALSYKQSAKERKTIKDCRDALKQMLR